MKHLLTLLIALSAGVAHANSPTQAVAAAPTFDNQMQAMAGQYMAIQAALAGDKMTDVAQNAAAIATAAATLDAKTIPAAHAAHLSALPGKIAAAATTLKAASDIKGAREAFKDLSKPMVMWASMLKPAGVSVMYCSMAKGSWLQTDTAIRNPYYGAQMLACGEIVGGAGQGAKGGHMKGQ
ncbi:MAG: hypothetical protein ACI9U2_001354 [Bradymonadia bacterium]|jgi:hypothetical protein